MPNEQQNLLRGLDAVKYFLFFFFKLESDCFEALFVLHNGVNQPCRRASDPSGASLPPPRRPAAAPASHFQRRRGCSQLAPPSSASASRSPFSLSAPSLLPGKQAVSLDPAYTRAGVQCSPLSCWLTCPVWSSLGSSASLQPTQLHSFTAQQCSMPWMHTTSFIAHPSRGAQGASRSWPLEAGLQRTLGTAVFRVTVFSGVCPIVGFLVTRCFHS